MTMRGQTVLAKTADAKSTPGPGRSSLKTERAIDIKRLDLTGRPCHHLAVRTAFLERSTITSTWKVPEKSTSSIATCSALVLYLAGQTMNLVLQSLAGTISRYLLEGR